MNVDGLNLLSMLSNSTDLEGIQQALLNQGLDSSEFSEALIKQVALLEQSTNLPDTANLAERIDDISVQELAGFVPQAEHQQELAVFEGTKLPPAKESDEGIDLERTIDVLQDVMDHIAEATAFIENASSTVSDAIEHVMEKLETELSAKQSIETVADAITPTIEIPEHDLEILEEATAAEIDLEDLVELPRHASLQGSELLMADTKAKQTEIPKQVAGQVEQDFSHVGMVMKKSSEKFDVPEVDEDNALSEFLKEDNALHQSDNEDPLMEAKLAEKNLQQIDSTSAENIMHKNLPKVASDIAQLNRQLHTPTKGEVPEMTKPFAHPEWQQEFGERILWMQTKSVQVAELRLNPQHLGPVTIRVDVNQDQATLAFTAQHGAVREAIEAAMPRLREMLQGQQINLAEVNISHQDASGQRQSQGFAQGNSDHQNQATQNLLASTTNELEESVVSITEEIEHSRTMASRGLLNIFA